VERMIQYRQFPGRRAGPQISCSRRRSFNMAIDYAGFLRQALYSGVPLDVALAALRRHGATPIDSIKAVREVEKLPLIDAKRLVSESPAWEDIREAHERLAEILVALEADV
jgi:hypothetical protein